MGRELFHTTKDLEHFVPRVLCEGIRRVQIAKTKKEQQELRGIMARIVHNNEKFESDQYAHPYARSKLITKLWVGSLLLLGARDHRKNAKFYEEEDHDHPRMRTWMIPIILGVMAYEHLEYAKRIIRGEEHPEDFMARAQELCVFAWTRAVEKQAEDFQMDEDFFPIGTNRVKFIEETLAFMRYKIKESDAIILLKGFAQRYGEAISTNHGVGVIRTPSIDIRVSRSGTTTFLVQKRSRQEVQLSSWASS